MSKLANQPAFPIPHPEMTIQGQTILSTQGMTYRQWLAGMAMQGLLMSINFGGGEYEDDYMPRAAKLAVMGADALIAELEKLEK